MFYYLILCWHLYFFIDTKDILDFSSDVKGSDIKQNIIICEVV